MSAEATLTVLVFVLVPITWVSTGLLLAYAWQKPRIGALTERAIIAVLISLLITSSAGLLLNAATGYAALPIETARVVYRVALLGIGLVPAAWLVLFASNRLGG